MNFVLHNVSNGERTVIPQMEICSWKDHSICMHGDRCGEMPFVMPVNLLIVTVQLFPALHEVVVYVQEKGKVPKL